MRKEKLIRRLKSLYLLEFINAFFLPLVFLTYCYLHDEPVGLSSLGALTLNGILLLQGSYFWFIIHRQLATNKTTNLIATFKFSRIMNLVLIIATIALMTTQPFKGTWDKYGTFAFLILAILEHINYYEFQLMYDNSNDLNYLKRFGLKKAKLKRLLTRN